MTVTAARAWTARRHGARSSEINVTPFVDVVLVLLIIFMLTAHVMEYGLEVNVPQTKSVRSSTRELPVVTITKTGEIYLGKEAVNIHLLGATIHDRYRRSASRVRARGPRNAFRPDRAGDQRTRRGQISGQPGDAAAKIRRERGAAERMQPASPGHRTRAASVRSMNRTGSAALSSFRVAVHLAPGGGLAVRSGVQDCKPFRWA